MFSWQMKLFALARRQAANREQPNLLIILVAQGLHFSVQLKIQLGLSNVSLLCPFKHWSTQTRSYRRNDECNKGEGEDKNNQCKIVLQMQGRDRMDSKIMHCIQYLVRHRISLFHKLIGIRL